MTEPIFGTDAQGNDTFTPPTRLGREHEPQPPMRRIKYEVGHAISGYLPDNPPMYFTNLKRARAAAVSEVNEYLEALGAYDDNGNRIHAGQEGHVSVTKEGEYKWRLNFGMGGSRYVYLDDVDEDLYFDDLGDVYQRHEQADGTFTWEYLPMDW